MNTTTIIKSLALFLSYAALNCNSQLPAKEPTPRPPSRSSLTLDDLADGELKKALEPYKKAMASQGCAKDFCFYLQTQVSSAQEEVHFNLSGSYNGANPPKEGIRAIFALCGAFWRYDPVLGREKWIGQCLPKPGVVTVPVESIKTGQPLILEKNVKHPLFAEAGYRIPHVLLYLEGRSPEPTLELGNLTKKE